MSYSNNYFFLHAIRIDRPMEIHMIVATACGSGRLIHATYDIVSAPCGLRERLPRAAAAV
jgi:hypothetical protein